MPVVKRQPQPEQPREHRLPQVGPHPLRRRRGQIGHQVPDQRPDPHQPDARSGSHRRQPRRPEPIQHPQRPSQRLPADRVVHRQLQGPRPRQIEQGLDQDQARGQGKTPPVGLEEAAKGLTTGRGWGGGRGWSCGVAGGAVGWVESGVVGWFWAWVGCAMTIRASRAGLLPGTQPPPSRPGEAPHRQPRQPPRQGLWTAAGTPLAGPLRSPPGAQVPAPRKRPGAPARVRRGRSGRGCTPGPVGEACGPLRVRTWGPNGAMIVTLVARPTGTIIVARPGAT
jgi:hypothetical protein